MWSLKGGVWSGKRGVWSVMCGELYKCGVWSLEC